jgi:hypothetical protein
LTDPTKKGGRESLCIHKRSLTFFLRVKARVVLAVQGLIKATRERASLFVGQRPCPIRMDAHSADWTGGLVDQDKHATPLERCEMLCSLYQMQFGES